MIRTLTLLTAFLFLYEIAHSQPSEKGATRPRIETKKFPFETASTILAISFSPVIEGVDPEIENDTAAVKTSVKGPRFRDTLGHQEVREVVKLRRKEINDLSHLVNELDCQGPTSRRLCYNPRNAILFLNQQGTIIAELDVCFECREFETKPTNFYVRDSRECMYEALRKVFLSAGIIYGVGAGK